jgi:hypothetical protein
MLEPTMPHNTTGSGPVEASQPAISPRYLSCWPRRGAAALP